MDMNTAKPRYSRYVPPGTWRRRVFVLLAAVLLSASAFGGWQWKKHRDLEQLKSQRLAENRVAGRNLADSVGLASLPSGPAPGSRAALRIWYLWALGPVRGVSIEQTDGRWHATEVWGYLGSGSHGSAPVDVPSGEQDALWTELAAENFFTVPDGAVLERLRGDSYLALDGYCLFVEVVRDGAYHAYAIWFAAEQTWPEASIAWRGFRKVEAVTGIPLQEIHP